MAGRFGPLGKRLAQYARGQDDRYVQPAHDQPGIHISRRCDDDAVDGLDPEPAFSQLLECLTIEMSETLKDQHLAGKLILLTLRVVSGKMAKRRLSGVCRERQETQRGSPKKELGFGF